MSLRVFAIEPLTAREVATYYATRVPHLKQVKAREWRGACPVHDGDGANFTVDSSTGQWHCHSQCGRGGDIFQLEASITGGSFPSCKAAVFDLIGRAEPKASNSAGRAGKLAPLVSSSHVSKTEYYPYVDENGTVLFEVVRETSIDGGKRFKQRRPNERGGWTWNLNGVRRVPYRLPKLVQADANTLIWLPEGEKCVHVLESFGLVASCNPGGSGSSRLYEEWQEYFRGKQLIILPDNDEPGRKHAADVLAALQLVAASARMVELPDLPPKGDVADWHEAGGTREQLLALAAQAPLLTPPNPVVPSSQPDLEVWVARILRGETYPDCYDPEFLNAVAKADAAHQVAQRLKTGFGPRFNIPDFKKRVSAVGLQLRTRGSGTAVAGMVLNSEGAPLALLANAVYLMDGLPIAYDEFSQCTVTTGELPWGTRSGAPWTDVDDLYACEWLQRNGVKVKTNIAAEGAQAVSMKRKLHPVREHLENLDRWDGKPRVDEWLAAYLGVEPSEYASEVGSKWLISAIARVYQPSCQADHALILEGKQGSGKSSALRILGREWFSDDMEIMGSKDSKSDIQGKWIIELSELDAIRGSEASRVKAFITRRADRYRPSYGRRSIDFPRQCVFAGTTNQTAWLRDDTGGRRFWPVTCGLIDVIALESDRDQLWAEALLQYRAGKKWYLSENVEKQAFSEQRDRYEEDVWSPLVTEYCEGKERVTVQEVLQASKIAMEPGRWRQHDQNRVASCLKTLGYKKKQFRGKDDRYWGYELREGQGVSR